MVGSTQRAFGSTLRVADGQDHRARATPQDDGRIDDIGGSEERPREECRHREGDGDGTWDSCLISGAPHPILPAGRAVSGLVATFRSRAGDDPGRLWQAGARRHHPEVLGCRWDGPVSWAHASE
jgi:hypothetical protein